MQLRIGESPDSAWVSAYAEGRRLDSARIVRVAWWGFHVASAQLTAVATHAGATFGGDRSLFS
jgi:hypothetical protein